MYMTMHQRLFALSALLLVFCLTLPVPASAVVIRGKVSLLGGHIMIRGGHIYIGATPAPAPGAIAISAKNSGTVSNASTVASNPFTLGLGTLPVGTMVVVAVNTRVTTTSGTETLADSGGNTWTQVSQQINATTVSNTAMFYSVLTTGLTNASTVTLSGTNFNSSNSSAFVVYALTNATTLDASNGTPNNSTSHPTVTSSTVTAGLTEVVLGFYGSGAIGGFPGTQPAGYTEDYNAVNGSIFTTAGSKIVTNSSGTYTYDPTINIISNGTSIIAVFR
jgi:hypothetical protein